MLKKAMCQLILQNKAIRALLTQPRMELKVDKSDLNNKCWYKHTSSKEQSYK
mgnify:CR=1 FL=1